MIYSLARPALMLTAIAQPELLLTALARPALMLTAIAQPALAAGSMDPGYREVIADADRAIGRAVDWTLRIRKVEKKFYSYTLETEYVPSRDEGPCARCRVTVRFRSRPEETARPPRFRPGQIIAVRGTVLAREPHPVVLAAKIQPR